MEAVFCEGVPDSCGCGCGGGGAEVVSFVASLAVLLRLEGFVGDDFGEGAGYGGYECFVGVEVLGDEDSGAMEEDVVPFCLQGGEGGRREGGVCGKVVDWDVLFNGCGEWVMDGNGFRGELFEGFELLRRGRLGEKVWWDWFWGVGHFESGCWN